LEQPKLDINKIRYIAMNKKALLDSALKCADYFVENQVKEREDANRGRTIRSYDHVSGEMVLTGNWQTGTFLMGLLAAYRRTGKEEYLSAAEFGGHYIMSLQVLDQRSRYYGVLRELTPQCIEFAPRDATTGAWALVWLYNFTGKKEYLESAMLFGDFHLRYCMCEGWPRYACYMDPELDDFYARGSFQSGTGLFYHDLFMASSEPKYIAEGMRPIADNYLKYFTREDGGLNSKLDIFTWKDVDEGQKDNILSGMHSFNDDFGNAMLQTAADIFKDEKYREAAYKYALWLADALDSDKGYCGHWSGVPVSLMYFHDLGNFYNDERLLKSREKALDILLGLQFANTGDGKLDGAFQGKYEGTGEVFGSGEMCMNTRCSSYALIALLKIESDLPDIWLGRNNKQFIDPLKKGETHKLVW
jgi:hypothetical protein